MRPLKAAALGALLSFAMLMPSVATADPFEPPPLEPRFWVDPVLGYAMDGYDPMSYHIVGEPLAGARKHEARWAGLVWRFANAANLEAFLLTPQLYAPRFGGYDVVSVARGHLSVGNPNVFVMREGQLYLFHSEVHRIMFLSAPGQFIRSAAKQWPKLETDVPLAIGLP